MKRLQYYIKHILFLLLLPLAGIKAQTLSETVMKARALRETGNSREAVALATGAARLNADARLWLEAAEASQTVNDLSAAIGYFNEACKTSEGSGEYGLARIYALKGDAATSLYHLGRSMSSPYKKTEREVMLDKSFSSIENSPAWRQFWKKQWYTGLEEGISELGFFISSGKTAEARTALDELKRDYPGSDELAYCEARLNLLSGKQADAVRQLTELVAADPGNFRYMKLLAQAQVSSSNPAGASVTYTRLLDMGADDASIYMLRADCYSRTGEYEKALKDIAKYLSLYPGNPDAIRLAGKTEAAAGDNLKAIGYFTRNIELMPGDAQAYADRADSYFIAGSWDFAISDYSMSLDLKPGNSDAYLNMGIALLKKGRKDDACIDFRKALELGNKRAPEYISKNCLR